MAKPKKQGTIPKYELETLARCLLPDIQAYYESDEGKQEFAEWKAALEKDKGQRKQKS